MRLYLRLLKLKRRPAVVEFVDAEPLEDGQEHRNCRPGEGVETRCRL